MRRCVALLFLSIPSVALAIGPAWLQKGTSLEGEAADLPLHRGVETDGRPAIAAEVGGEPVLAILDVVSGPTRIGRDLAGALGLDVQTRRMGGDRVRVTTIPELRAGSMVLRRVRARVVAGDALVLGLGAVPELAVAVMPSEGRVRLAPVAEGEALLDAVGEPQELLRQGLGSRRSGGEQRTGDGLSATVGVQGEGLDGSRLGVRTDVARSRVGTGLLPLVQAADGGRRAELRVSVGEVDLPPTLAWVDGGLVDADSGGVGILGYDVLYALDLARVGDRLALRSAPSVTWHDPAPARVAEADARLAAWREVHGAPAADDRPARMGFDTSVSHPEGDRGDPAATAFHRDLAAVLWKAGASDKAVQRTLEATTHAGDQCLPHMELGERRLRTAGARLTQKMVGELVRGPLEHAGTLYRSWLSLDPQTRQLARRGRAIPGDQLAIEQPDACGRAWGLLMAALLAVGELDRVSELYTLHRGVHYSVPHMLGLALLDHDPAEAEARLREAVVRGGRDDVDLRLALARAQVAQGKEAPARAWLAALPWRDIEHPLTAALIAHELGAELPALYPEPGLLAAHIAAAVAGSEVDQEAVEAALTIAEQRWPGAAQLEAMRAVWMAAQGTPIPAPTDRPHLADAWAAKAAIAARTGDRSELEEALRELHTRFPEIPAGALGL